MPHRWLQGGDDGPPDALGTVGPAAAPAGPRPRAPAARAAPPAVAGCPGQQDRAAPAPGTGAAPRGIWHPGGRPTGVSGVRLADQYSVHGAREPVEAPACGGGGAPGDDAGPRRTRRTPAAGMVPCLLPRLPPARLLTPGSPPARTHPGDGLRQAMEAPNAGDGGWVDRSRVDAARGAAVPRAAVAAARGGVSKQWWWAAARGGSRRRRCASTQPAARTSTGGRGPLGGRESPLISAFCSCEGRPGKPVVMIRRAQVHDSVLMQSPYDLEARYSTKGDTH